MCERRSVCSMSSSRTRPPQTAFPARPRRTPSGIRALDRPPSYDVYTQHIYIISSATLKFFLLRRHASYFLVGTRSDSVARRPPVTTINRVCGIKRRRERRRAPPRPVSSSDRPGPRSADTSSSSADCRHVTDLEVPGRRLGWADPATSRLSELISRGTERSFIPKPQVRTRERVT